MAMNGIVRESLDLMAGMIALPFTAVDQFLGDRDTATTNMVKKANSLAREMALMPVEAARDFFVPEEPRPKDGN